MTEIIEYSLVVMVSALFVAGSAATYNSFSSYQSSIQLRAESFAVSSLVSQAVKGGSSSGTLDLPASTLRCEGGSLTFSSGSNVQSISLPLGCNFTADLSGGWHVMNFSVVSDNLILKVK